jgi:hypothetical protein
MAVFQQITALPLSRHDQLSQFVGGPGLSPDVFLSDRAVAPLGNSYHAASAFELADDTGPLPGSKGDRVGCDLGRRAPTAVPRSLIMV